VAALTHKSCNQGGTAGSILVLGQVLACSWAIFVFHEQEKSKNILIKENCHVKRKTSRRGDDPARNAQGANGAKDKPAACE